MRPIRRVNPAIRKPFREIVVEMGDRFYKPKAIEVKRGEQVRFVIRNDGHEDHESLDHERT